MTAEALVVLAKTPVAGSVKTRLQPVASVEESAALAAAMARDVLERSWPFARRVLAVAGGRHRYWEDAASEGWEVVEQRGAHLGERMWNAVRFAGGTAVILGTDSPHLPTESVLETAQALASHDGAWVPADDGGYVCIAATPRASALFGALPWGSADVLAETRRRARSAGLRTCEVGGWYDLDEIADLRRLWLDSAACRERAPHTLMALKPLAARLRWSAAASPME